MNRIVLLTSTISIGALRIAWWRSLRAIHLLLAFPLFVVVVAVVPDGFGARSRTSSIDAFGRPSKDGYCFEKEADERDDASPTTRKASTDDYLEKIFQVPFWLQPLSDTGCRDLLMNLIPRDQTSGGRIEGNVQRQPDMSHDDGQVTSAPGREIDSSRPANPAKPTKPAWTPVTAQPKTLQITDKEREYMLQLAPIIGRSPRAVKRFINCYRLAKAMLDPDNLEWFASDDPNRECNFHGHVSSRHGLGRT